MQQVNGLKPRYSKGSSFENCHNLNRIAIVTQMYDSTTQQLTARLRGSVPTLAEGKPPVVSMVAPEIGGRDRVGLKVPPPVR
ncbi:hypothetical protein MC7420_380 [Coleofasciculus chthonoplastes PCC 7420]|uniref:Uncharacterized protein n=1 Tax=Coleofasciculus chthonoplastes PCC 7420 TaxID=118168 RepID=B4VLB7_9CYAN|nr:hypothetical protein [Coleofasciculus chthonoplastes]EDX77243.1 hypothetical protein MC7420_380 [Coleofasciculus chthonoplastes PCC 7420]